MDDPKRHFSLAATATPTGTVVYNFALQHVAMAMAGRSQVSLQFRQGTKMVFTLEQGKSLLGDLSRYVPGRRPPPSVVHLNLDDTTLVLLDMSAVYYWYHSLNGDGGVVVGTTFGTNLTFKGSHGDLFMLALDKHYRQYGGERRDDPEPQIEEEF